MKRSISALFALVLSLGVISSTKAQEQETPSKPITAKGSTAIVFSFGGLGSFDMNALQLASVLFPGETQSDAVIVYAAGMKYYLADDVALRALVGFSTLTKGDPDPAKSPNGKTVTTNYGIAVGGELHTRAFHAISPYFGAQLSYGAANADYTENVVDLPNGKSDPVLATTTTKETKYTGSVFGIGLVAGFDWYVYKGLALGAEYTLGFSSASASSTVSGSTTNEPSTSSLGIGMGGIHMLLHF